MTSPKKYKKGDYRHCTKCKRWLEITPETFYIQGGAFLATCKECCRQYKRGRYPIAKANKFKRIVGER